MTNTNLQTSLQTNWQKLRELIDATLPATCPQWFTLLDAIRDDTLTSDGKLLLGFYRAPAAKGYHHAYEGGLIAHLLEMWHTYTVLRDNFPVLTQQGEHITDSRVLTAILAHDLHKAYLTFVLDEAAYAEGRWSTSYASDHPSENLLTHDVKSLSLLMRYGISMDDEQLNAFCWAEGGWSSIQPKWTSVLAKLCYLLDEFSGNVLARIAARTLLDHRKPLPDVSEQPAILGTPAAVENLPPVQAFTTSDTTPHRQSDGTVTAGTLSGEDATLARSLGV